MLADISSNANGPVYLNQVDVRSTLASLQAQLDSIQHDSDTKNIYYSDSAPGGPLEDGDIWFDSHNLRLNVRHTGAWVFPDRVEDTALKASLLNAVTTSTDYESLKIKLMAALL